MEITLSDNAKKKITSSGGSVAVDFVKPVGCGKVSEVSASTNLKGRNTSAYRRINQDGVIVFLAQDLVKYVNQIELVMKKGLIGSKLIVRTPSNYKSNCDI